jgi:2-dehydro-3-deoxyphosphogluconate aldolase / (4S)-4-hydroxy-2-oxoglutarate aldolase
VVTERPQIPAALTSSGIVAIARGASTTHVAAAIDVLMAEGITCIELTLTMPGAIDSMSALVRDIGDSAFIGAGTVLTLDQARACIDAGARFLVAPSIVPDVVEFALTANIPCFPGAFTPSEIVSAWLSGAAAVKLFPASAGGPRYLRDVRAPLPDIPIVPTGGVGIDDIPAYLAAGAIAVGLGGPLFGNVLNDGDFAGLQKRARGAVEAVRQAREGTPV